MFYLTGTLPYYSPVDIINYNTMNRTRSNRTRNPPPPYSPPSDPPPAYTREQEQAIDLEAYLVSSQNQTSNTTNDIPASALAAPETNPSCPSDDSRPAPAPVPTVPARPPPTLTRPSRTPPSPAPISRATLALGKSQWRAPRIHNGACFYVSLAIAILAMGVAVIVFLVALFSDKKSNESYYAWVDGAWVSAV